MRRKVVLRSDTIRALQNAKNWPHGSRKEPFVGPIRAENDGIFTLRRVAKTFKLIRLNVLATPHFLCFCAETAVWPDPRSENPDLGCPDTWQGHGPVG